MSAQHPIIAITGSSGSGVTFVTRAFEHILWRVRARGVYIQGNAFHRYDRKTMREEVARAEKEGRILSHFGPEGNMLDKLETLFFQYGATGGGQRRYYLHSREDAEEWGLEPGTFTPWEELEPESDLLVYKGLHGAAIAGDIDLSRYPDLLIGVVPNVNLEWIRKISRDTSERGYSFEEVRRSILRRMPDYVRHITPQFGRTHINFQTISTVDTSDPFNSPYLPTDDESFLVIHFQNCQPPELGELCRCIPGAFLSRATTLVVPGGKKMMAMELILAPIVQKLVDRGRELRGVEPPSAAFRGGLQGLI
ncbi:MAG TPA: phosphoribulokinase [Sedimenticola sp.]|nr:phosphoribulokinase [Sedimenticola sp.]